jgi:Cdc6-like AAA superfamily ATPase
MNKQIINNIDDFIFYKDKIKKINQWFIDFKNNNSTKRILLIIGNVGTGKTFIANTFFKLYKYKIYEINSIDIRSKKKIEELFNKSLKYNSVIDMFNNSSCSMAILLDELETIVKNLVLYIVAAYKIAVDL